MSEENAAIARRFYEEVFDEGNLDAADDFLAAGVADHEGFKKSLAALFAAFPDLSVALEDVVSAGDKVIVRWTDRGTHRGEFLGVAPTGRRVATTGITVFRFAGGKIAEQWTNWDTLGLTAQLGATGGPPRDLVGRVLASQEDERRRVAYEVHDGLAQTAVAAHGLLEAYAEGHPPGSAEARKELERVLGLVREVVEESRRVIGRLRPTALDDFGLAAALRLQVEALREEGWEVGYDAEALGDERLPAAVETALFRVAQEALNNAKKHAGTTRARVELERGGGAVRLRVRDWGRGFGPREPSGVSAPGERIGLHGMRERVALIGGTFEVLSEPGSGTLVVVEVPLPEAEGTARGG